MKKIILLALIFLLVVSLAQGVTLECFNDGSIKIEGMSKKWSVRTQEEYSSNDYFAVPGQYYSYRDEEKKKKFNFYSDEAVFVSQKGKTYDVGFGSYEYSLPCPAFTFSCRIFNISVDYCYTN